MRYALGCVVAMVAFGCASEPGPGPEEGRSGVTELTVVDDRVGDGNEAAAGQQVTVHYTGWLYDAGAPDNRGRQFDSSRGGEPLEFRLGAGNVIPGWDQGVAGMRVGGRRTLTIPPALGYGSQGFPGAIPPDATLVFDVELLDVR
jgi:FKBP-type peptidyl-prolyl cis-trans isomerase